MSDLLEEANNDYEYNKRVSIFKALLPYVIVLTVMIVAAYSVYSWRNNSYIEKITEKSTMLNDVLFDKVISKENVEQGLKSLAHDKDSIADLARFELTARNYSNKSKEEVLADLENIVSNSSSQLTTNLTKLQIVGILLDNQSLSDSESKKILNYIVGIDKTQPLYFNAQIYYALYNIKISNINGAEDTLKNILSNNSISDSIRNQAEVVMSFVNDLQTKLK